jgi:hypothetical protein
LVAEGSHGAEVAFVEGEQVEGVVAAGQHYVGGVGEPKVEVGVALEHGAGRGDVGGRERLEAVRAAFDLGEQRQLLPAADLRGEQAVELGENERRDEERTIRALQGLASRAVLALGGVDGGEQAAGVEYERHPVYRSPKPGRGPRPASSSSTRSESVGSPESNSGILGRGGSCPSNRALTASRISSASLLPVSPAARSRPALTSSGKYTVVFFMPYMIPYVREGV